LFQVLLLLLLEFPTFVVLVGINYRTVENLAYNGSNLMTMLLVVLNALCSTAQCCPA